MDRVARSAFDVARQRVGRVLAPLVFFIILVAPTGLPAPAHRLAAIFAATVVLWVCEAVPLGAAALIAPALAVAMDVTPAAKAFAPFASPLIFLFLGGFMLALGLSEQGLDRRAALWLLARDWVRGSPARARTAVGLGAFACSMWISNTATTAMLIPVALGLCAAIRGVARPEDQPKFDRYAEGMLLTLTYACSIGGIATPIGTAPNVIALDFLERQAGIQLDFFQWISFGLPTGLVTLAIALVYAHRRFPSPVDRLDGLTVEVREQLRALGPLSAGERRAAGVFLLAVLGWLLPSILKVTLGAAHPAAQWADRCLQEGVVATLAGVLLCIVPGGRQAGVPVLPWDKAMKLDWSTLYLLGGGFSLGAMMFDTGLAEALARGFLAIAGPLASSPFGLLATATFLVLWLTEVTSNVATTSMMVPVLIAIAQAAGIDPLPTTLCVTMAASFAFTLPVSTPPNAIAYGTGLIRIQSMIRFGIVLDLLGYLVLIACGALLLPALGLGL
ncbi:SLC13 family permease [Nannocystis bainbridge]|uniref:DASS family sodium-coupled anion symporter n=1 Tax=Nannocystis bainbridge TaxID=2995303 RepID=A0ABT5DXI7_9BACT|nr:DASS family sodium-coupled anion symporter [Nannocystis bainbridge]MDC0718327.1 DASS family sodium-coupled anion symporter [Nannocystis bainbridge]